jgi:glycosyltransferase involved in cell wall biosynthesis
LSDCAPNVSCDVQPHRVLFVSPFSSDTGGAERSLYSILENLPRNRVVPEVLALAPAASALRARLQSHSIPLHEARFRTWFNIRSKRKGHLRLARLLDNLRVAWKLARVLPPYDLIYSNSTYSPIGAMIAMLRRLPHIWHIHEHMVFDLSSDYQLDWPPQWSMGWAQRHTQVFIVYSQATWQRWASCIQPERLRLVDPGVLHSSEIASPRLAPLHFNKLVMCIVGGLSPAKGQHEAVQALAILRHEMGVDARLQIAGEGSTDYKESLRTLAAELGVSDAVDFRGFVSAFSVFDSNDVHIMCTRSESAPRVAIESMARGCPTVATDIDGVREFIIDGVTGLHYPVGQPEVLAQRVLELWQTSTRYAQCSQNGVELVRERFLVNRLVNDIVTLIQEVITGTRTPSP